MGLSKVGTNDRLLDISSLVVGESYRKVAYFYRFKHNVTSTLNGFYTIYLKDRNGKVIIGNLFNVEYFESTGVMMQALKGKAVISNFKVGDFNGTPTLQLDTLEEYTGDVDYSEFVGKVSGVEDYYEFVKTIFGKCGIENPSLPAQYKTKSLRDVYDGRAGGYIKLLEMVMNNLVSLNDILGFDRDEMVRTFYYVQELFYKYLYRIEDVDFITTKMKMDIIINGSMQVDGIDVSHYVIDALSDLLGVCVAETLQGLVLSKSFKDNMETLTLGCEYDKMLEGVKKKVGDREFLKY